MSLTTGSLNDIPPEASRRFRKLKFSSIGINAVNLSNILRHRKVLSIPKYFKSKSKPCISYKYTPTIASKLFDYKPTLQCLNILNPPSCSCSSSPFNYKPLLAMPIYIVHVTNEELCHPFWRSQIKRAPVFQMTVELYFYHGFCGRWAKLKKEELNFTPEWVKSIRSISKSRIKHVRSEMRTTRHTQSQIYRV
jgi:hypothetical protein